MAHTSYAAVSDDDGDGVYYYIGERLKLEGKTENVGVGTKKRGSMKAVVLYGHSVPKISAWQRGE